MNTKAIDKAIAELKTQKAHLEQVIAMIEMIASGKRRRGRPPKFLSEALRAAKEKRPSKARQRKKRSGPTIP